MLTREQILEVDTYCAEHQVSQQRYLDEHNIPRHQYYVWKRKYRQEDEQSSEPGAFVQLRPGGEFVSPMMPPAKTSGKAKAKTGSIHVAVAHAKCAIPILPCEMAERIARLLIDPSRCARFHGPHNLRQIHLLAQQKQNVHMIRGAAHLYGRTPVVVENLRHICLHLLQIRLWHRIRTAFGGEHQVDIYLC